MYVSEGEMKEKEKRSKKKWKWREYIFPAHRPIHYSISLLFTPSPSHPPLSSFDTGTHKCACIHMRKNIRA